jgi:hypothetical protein
MHNALLARWGARCVLRRVLKLHLFCTNDTDCRIILPEEVNSEKDRLLLFYMVEWEKIPIVYISSI